MGKGALLRAFRRIAPFPSGEAQHGHAEPVIGPAHRVRPLAGPVAGFSRSKQFVRRCRRLNSVKGHQTNYQNNIA
jgi:hypothetical protein